MYTPKHFALSDLALARRLIDEQPFAMLVGPDAQGQSFVTHLPLSWGSDEEGWWLEGHMARANPHWAWLAAQGQVLAVFSGPDGYISPTHYETRLNVPTWNYLAVHVHGALQTIDEAAAKDALLKRLIARHEPGYAEQWRGLPEDFQHKLLGAIVGFRIRVERWEAKAKLSQNRSALERARIIAHSEAGTAKERELARWMHQLGLGA
ncbi:FMN-binding negative transcriptional regulator [Paucibacter sp. M5-1]|uniref:FMN-binding negative transcriptional regulator n=1 Tax=Paucibacter sp. M5-1 TaxID=3015998 RepID=UPI0022B8728A|nr:FMN-binding negative transcriptional regulator [Paucibacter sp. M5-1]MCZ7882979.1 FMN-binding negative transcriptional regulator [Paucibacter sp. M5-1]